MNFLSRGFPLFVLGISLVHNLSAQQPAADVAKPVAVEPASSVQTPPTTNVAPPIDKRVFGVLPNYRTAQYSENYTPITAKQKMTIASKDSFDYPLLGLGAVYAALYQLEDNHPQFGQGLKGYAKRFATSYTDQIIGNMLSEGVFPSLLHEDPRYFRLGEGTKKHRFTYALTRVVVTRTDSGGRRFNFSELLGNGTATLIGWSYYTDTRNPEDYFQALGTQIATDAFSQVLKEFWPDIKHRFFKHHETVRAD